MGRTSRTEASRARQRERQYRALQKASAIFVGLFAFAVAVVLGLNAWTEWEWAARFTPVQATGEAVRLPLADVGDGQAHFYAYEGSRSIRFFVVRSPDGVFRAAFDACETCFEKRKGYRQDGDVLVCRKCGETFLFRQVNGPRGECVPAPLERAVEGDFLVLRVRDLDAGARYF